MIEIEFRTRISLEQDRGSSPDDYRNFFVTSEGRISATDDSDKEANVGTLTAVLIDAARAAQAGQNLWDAADAYDGDMERLITVFYNRNGEIRVEMLLDADACVSQPNILYISNVEIEPKYRGQGIALAAIRRAIDLLSVGSELVVLKPFPLQFVGQVNDTNKKEVDEAVSKLKRYYQLMGFKNVKKTGFMALDLTRRLEDVLLPEHYLEEDEDD